MRNSTRQPGNSYPVAYCAPGRRAIAEQILAARGEEVTRIVEHPWLEGTTGVYVVAEDPLDLTRLLPHRYEFPQPPTWTDDNWRYGLLVNTSSPSLLFPMIS